MFTAAISSLCILALFLYLVYGPRRSRALYSDKGIESKVFHDRERNIKAKPDRIEGSRDNARLIEYKSRRKGVYPSDIAQVLSSVLAVRASGYNVQKAIITTGDGKEKNVILGDDESIAMRINAPLENARLVATGGIPAATPSKGKCVSCSVKRACKYAAK